MDLLQIINISKSYKGFCAIKDININVPKGSLFGLLGRNGAGKTTLLRIINQLIKPDSGEILYNNERITRDVLSTFGFLPEERGLYSRMRVSDQIIYFGLLKDLDKQTAIRNMEWWFSRLGVDDWQNKKIEDLSKGMQQKIQLIVALINFPKFLILDEPFSGFDPVTIEAIKELIIELNNKGTTTILSTHNLSIAEELCDNIAIINNKQVVIQGELNKLYSEYGLNKYMIELKDDRESIFENEHIRVLDHKGSSVELEVDEKIDFSDILIEICKQTKIVGFSKRKISLKDLFLKVTNEEYNNTNESQNVE